MDPQNKDAPENYVTKRDENAPTPPTRPPRFSLPPGAQPLPAMRCRVRSEYTTVQQSTSEVPEEHSVIAGTTPPRVGSRISLPPGALPLPGMQSGIPFGPSDLRPSPGVEQLRNRSENKIFRREELKIVEECSNEAQTIKSDNDPKQYSVNQNLQSVVLHEPARRQLENKILQREELKIVEECSNEEQTIKSDNDPKQYSGNENLQSVVLHEPARRQLDPNNIHSASPMNLNHSIPSLQYLTGVDRLLIRQEIELLDAFVGIETNNKYTILNSNGEKLYYAAEINDCCTRCCCCPQRPFESKIIDIYRNELIHLNRPLACEACCFPCCLQSLEVSSPPGTVIGSVEQEWSICIPRLVIKDPTGQVVLRIKGPFFQCSCTGDVIFDILSADGEAKVGAITKRRGGCVDEMCTDAHIEISFPIDLDVRVKAILLGAFFLIDFMYFETPK